MEQHDFLQGSTEWYQHRASHFNASDSPAMLGISQYKTRNQLLREIATGIAPEVDAATQRRFDDGHRFEALARPLAERIIGKKLYPVIGSEGKLSASFDGLTADDTVCWEHKSANAALLESLRNMTIPEQYLPQMEQQLMLSGAERCLFSATKWEGDVLIEEAHCWYISDQAMRERILQGWTQFSIDLENYQHVEHAEKPKAEAILNLPALAVQATGMVTYSNLPEFKAAAENYIANINTDLQTDQQFSDAEATVKFCKSTEETLEVTKKAILSQTPTIDEVIRTVDHIQEQLRDKRLMLGKLVKSEKVARKSAMVNDTALSWRIHVADLQKEIRGVDICALITAPNFAAAIKGLGSLASMHDALDTALANAKIEADAIAKDVRAKLAWMNEHWFNNGGNYAFLFHDLQQITTKQMEDFTLTITSRIKEHKEAEARKEAEIRAKAEADASAKLEADRAAIQTVEEAKERHALLQTEPTAPRANTENSNVVVIEHQDSISAFLASRDFGREAGKVRAIIVEYVKFEAQFSIRVGAGAIANS